MKTVNMCVCVCVCAHMGGVGVGVGVSVLYQLFCVDVTEGTRRPFLHLFQAIKSYSWNILSLY